jgi:glycosyltransferase involved in cell wall biosynthesis
MSVYKNDKAADFLVALRSVTVHQTVSPDELILVVDGPIAENLEQQIATFQQEYSPMQVIRLATNQGHAAARQTAIDNAQYPLITIMDSDDIARADRFEKELAFMENHPEVDVIGGQIEEFDTDEQHIVSKRIVPQTDEDIKQYLQSRCPMNFQTIMARKEAVMKVGGIIDWFCEEDYYLWIRMAQNDCSFANLPDTLVSVRVGDALYSRRGGWKYFVSERGIQRYMLKHRIITCPRYIYNVLGRFVVQVCIPNQLRAFIFQKFFRK